MIPSDPIVWRKDVPPELKKHLKEFFLTYGKKDAREAEILRKITFSGFVESSNAQLKPIRQLELFKDRTRIAADAKLPEAERKTRLSDIDRNLAELK